MLIAVLSALDAEIRALRDASTGLERADVATWPAWTGRIHEHDLVMARAGLGKVNTAALCGVIWERFHPQLVLFTGVAGGLDPGLDIGDIVVGERTIQHDWGIETPSGLERYQAGHLSFYNPTDAFGFEPSDALLENARAAAALVELTPVSNRQPQIAFGTILTGDQFLQDGQKSAMLFSKLGAQAVEMEGAAVGQACERLGVDHLVIRSLSDRAAEESIVDFNEFVSQVAANSAALVSALLEQL